MCKYKFSFVIPIYNVENYIRETIESVIGQTIGFEDNIQLILVNDGSPDNSEKICLEYAGKYPDNIRYLKQENKGVSAARNYGLEYVEGKYVNFLDSDDTWNRDVCRKVWSYFEKHTDEIDFIAGRMKYFEAKNSYHVLDYKFEKKRQIVDIYDRYQFVQLSMATTFVKASALKGLSFDTELKIAEDMKLINIILLEKCKYGIMKDVQYNYRSRFAKTSALQGSKFDASWYLTTPKKCHEFLIEYSRKKFGEVIPYIQSVIMYDLQWRLRHPVEKDIAEDIIKEYQEIMAGLLQTVNDTIVCEQKYMYSEDRIYALCLKYGRDIQTDLAYRNHRLYFRDIFICNLKNYSVFTIRIIERNGDNLHIEGRINTFVHREDCRYYVRCRKDLEIPLEFFRMPNDVRVGMNGVIGERTGFKADIPIKRVKMLRFFMKYKDENEMRLMLAFGKFTGLDRTVKHSYCIKGGYLFKPEKTGLNVLRYSRRTHMGMEWKHLRNVIAMGKFRVVFYRVLYYLNKKRFRNKKIWFVSDQQKMAGDNGEHLFRYIMEKKTEEIQAYFVLSKGSKDISKMQKSGPVLIEFSLKHKLYSLFASKVISSHANETSINPFLKERAYIKDLYHFDYVFLQHGLTKDDLSKWLNKYNKNIGLFVTAAKPEYSSILNGNYFYDKNVVKLTGFPRYDHLFTEEKPKKEVLVIPTWRKNLAEWDGLMNTTGERRYNPFFKESEYYIFYNTLLNDKRLLDVLKECGYRVKFCNHPALRQQNRDFSGNDYVHIHQGDIDYQKEFKENSLLVTDFSSVAFDFAYLHKPVIYTHFDREEFFEGQVYDVGYFDYERDGFGPVCYDYETTLEAIINSIRNGCRLEDEYAERIEAFYEYHDNRNCERVYRAILEME